MQKKTFPDGGFVLHKVTGNFKGHASVWYAKDGLPIDAEIHNGRGGVSSYNLKKGQSMTTHFEVMGRIHKN